MSFLSWPVHKANLSSRAQQRRKEVIVGLMGQFEKTFPGITYELLWESSSINSVAWRLGEARYIRVYGGLVRHPGVTRAGLALILAHETGHHLGGPPYDPDMPWISWQGQADYWAAGVGIKKVFGLNSRSITLRGVRELCALHQEFCGNAEEDEPDLPVECRHQILIAGLAAKPMPDCAQNVLRNLIENSSTRPE